MLHSSWQETVFRHHRHVRDPVIVHIKSCQAGRPRRHRRCNRSTRPSHIIILFQNASASGSDMPTARGPNAGYQVLLPRYPASRLFKGGRPNREKLAAQLLGPGTGKNGGTCRRLAHNT
jgi:hypothetical protein